MSNVVQHGMESSSQVNPGSLSITITVETFQDRTTMTIEDNGRPFDVVHAPSKAIDQPLEQLRPGGLGIHLIKNFASKLSYNRTESGNRVTVEFTG
jgi:serine/threonine-protein kinase RsbW